MKTKLFTLTQAVDILTDWGFVVSRTQISDAIATGKLPAVRRKVKRSSMGAPPKLRVRHDELIAWAEEYYSLPAGMITCSQASIDFNVPLRSIYNAIKAGKLNSTKRTLGSRERIYVYPDDVGNWIFVYSVKRSQS